MDVVLAMSVVNITLANVDSGMLASGGECSTMDVVLTVSVVGEKLLEKGLDLDIGTLTSLDALEVDVDWVVVTVEVLEKGLDVQGGSSSSVESSGRDFMVLPKVHGEVFFKISFIKSD